MGSRHDGVAAGEMVGKEETERDHVFKAVREPRLMDEGLYFAEVRVTDYSRAYH
jgi:hypothetical protein